MATFEHLRYEPYSFGECHEKDVTVLASCSAWKEERCYINILLRREGSEVKIHFPTVKAKMKKGKGTSDCKIELDLYHTLRDPESQYYIPKAPLSFIGSMFSYDEDERRSHAVPAEVKILSDGTVTFTPMIQLAGMGSETENEEMENGIITTTLTTDTHALLIKDEDDIVDEEHKELDENGVPYSWIRKTIQVNVSCNSWKEFSKTANIFIAKDAEKPTEGVIVIPRIMYEIRYDGYSKNYQGSEILIEDGNQIMDFFGKVPDHFISEDGVAYGYFPKEYDTCFNYDVMKAALYYYNNCFHVCINDEMYHHFYPNLKGLIKPRKIGLKNKWPIRFKIPDRAVYVNANDNQDYILMSTLNTDPKYRNKDCIVGTIKVTMVSDAITAPVEKEIEYSFVYGYVTFNMQEIYQQIRVTQFHIPCNLNLKFDEDIFEDLFGGYFPPGIIGECSLRIYDRKLRTYRNSVDSSVFCAVDHLEIFPDSNKMLDRAIFTNVPSELQGNGADYIGIENLDMVFKIEKSVPHYTYESSIFN